MLSFSEANTIIQTELKRIQYKVEEIDLVESTGRILAENIIADVNLPPFDNSAMDGYAIKYSAEINKWKVKGEISAGNFTEISVEETNAVSIMTGAQIPHNCDVIIPIEDVEFQNDFIQLKENTKIKPNLNIRRKGEDLEKGKIALAKNTLLKSHHIAVAAACGREKLKVYAKLKIGVLATGDELVDLKSKPREDKIRCSNLYSLLSAVKEMNMHGVNLGIVCDKKELIKDRINLALESDLDIFITTGGVSVGKYDYIKEIHEAIGIDIKFWRVYIKPGKPLLFGVYENNGKTTIVFGLPGNPVSCLVNFLLFVKMNLDTLLNLNQYENPQAVLKDDVIKKDKKRHFMRGQLKRNINGGFEVSKVGSQSSGNLAQMGQSNCLFVVEEETMNPKKGDLVECIMI